MSYFSKLLKLFTKESNNWRLKKNSCCPWWERPLLSFSHPLLLSDQFLPRAGGYRDNLLCGMKPGWHLLTMVLRKTSSVALKADVFPKQGKCTGKLPQRLSFKTMPSTSFLITIFLKNEKPQKHHWVMRIIADYLWMSSQIGCTRGLQITSKN